MFCGSGENGREIDKFPADSFLPGKNQGETWLSHFCPGPQVFPRGKAGCLVNTRYFPGKRFFSVSSENTWDPGKNLGFSLGIPSVNDQRPWEFPGFTPGKSLGKPQVQDAMLSLWKLKF